MPLLWAPGHFVVFLVTPHFNLYQSLSVSRLVSAGRRECLGWLEEGVCEGLLSIVCGTELAIVLCLCDWWKCGPSETGSDFEPQQLEVWQGQTEIGTIAESLWEGWV